MSHDHGKRREPHGHDHGGGHDGDDRCPCCGGDHRHATYFSEHLREWQESSNYRAYRKFIESYHPHERPKKPKPDCKPDCAAQTVDGRTVRKATSAMTAEDWTRFQNAWLAMCASRFVGGLVEIHRGPYRMHGGGISGRRFLPWHRVFLLRLEEEIHRVDPCAVLPYWDWDPDKSFPSGIRTFLPTVTMPDGSAYAPTRGAWSTNPSTTAPPWMPATGTEAFVIAAGDYTEHVSGNQGAHDTVHNAVGGSMSAVLTSPSDPVFWMHHANADRLWHEWQQLHPGAATGLTGADAVMDPWSETDTAILDIAALGYTYV